MVKYKDLKAWCDRYGLLWVDGYPYHEANSIRPGVTCLAEDFRWVKDLNDKKDKSLVILYCDGKWCRRIEGVKKIDQIDEFTWRLEDRRGDLFRIYGWWSQEQMKIKEEFIKLRYIGHSALMNKWAEYFEGDKEEALKVNLPIDNRKGI
jgi:hypothetical protein